MNVGVYVYVFLYTFIDIHVYMYMYACIYVYKCTFMDMYVSGAKPEILQRRGGFANLGHCHKHFVKNSEKKTVHRNFRSFFS